MNKNISEKETINAIAEATGITKKKIKLVIDAYRNVICNEIKNDNKFVILGLGAFLPRKRSARIGHNPRTKEKLEIPEKKTIGFRASLKLLKEINENNEK